MKINILNSDYPYIFEHCCSLLCEMNFNIQHCNSETGHIQASKSNIRIMDLIIRKQDGWIKIILMPGLLSKDFCHIGYDNYVSAIFIDLLKNNLTKVNYSGGETSYSNKPELMEL